MASAHQQMMHHTKVKTLQKEGENTLQKSLLKYKAILSTPPARRRSGSGAADTASEPNRAAQNPKSTTGSSNPKSMICSASAYTTVQVHVDIHPHLLVYHYRGQWYLVNQLFQGCSPGPGEHAVATSCDSAKPTSSPLAARAAAATSAACWSLSGIAWGPPARMHRAPRLAALM